jgi:hypothetical protein
LRLTRLLRAGPSRKDTPNRQESDDHGKISHDHDSSDRFPMSEEEGGLVFGRPEDVNSGGWPAMGRRLIGRGFGAGCTRKHSQRGPEMRGNESHTPAAAIVVTVAGMVVGRCRPPEENHPASEQRQEPPMAAVARSGKTGGAMLPEVLLLCPAAAAARALALVLVLRGFLFVAVLLVLVFRVFLFALLVLVFFLFLIPF